MAMVRTLTGQSCSRYSQWTHRRHLRSYDKACVSPRAAGRQSPGNATKQLKQLGSELAHRLARALQRSTDANKCTERRPQPPQLHLACLALRSRSLAAFLSPGDGLWRSSMQRHCHGCCNMHAPHSQPRTDSTDPSSKQGQLQAFELYSTAGSQARPLAGAKQWQPAMAACCQHAVARGRGLLRPMTTPGRRLGTVMYRTGALRVDCQLAWERWRQRRTA